MSHLLETQRALAEVCDNNNVSFDTDRAVIDCPVFGTMRVQHENDIDDNRRRVFRV
jgi:hypothetical protein